MKCNLNLNKKRQTLAILQQFTCTKTQLAKDDFHCCNLDLQSYLTANLLAIKIVFCKANI